MRLLIVSQYFWPENFRVNDLARALVERGHQVTVLTGLPNYPTGEVFAEYLARPDDFRRYHGVDVVRVPMLPRKRGSARLLLNYVSFVATASTVGVWRLRGRTFDAVFVYQPSPVTSCLPAIVLGRMHKAPVVLWTLDLWPETLQAIGVVTTPALLRLVGLLVGFIYRHCALVLGQSRAFESNVTRLARDPKKFRYFPQWSEPIFGNTAAAAEVAPEAAPFAHTFNVLFAGNVGDAQDFPAILDAAEALRTRQDINWLVVGDGRAGEWVRREIASRGLSANVHMLGRHALERMPEFFRAAGALLVTLKRDPVFALTIPGKVQTYLASGLPLIGMLDGEGARVIVEAGAGVTCAAGDSRALAACVCEIAAMTSVDRGAMGQRALAYSQREFDRDSLLAQLEAWLSELPRGAALMPA